MKNTFLGSRESETRAYLALSTRWMTWWSQKTEQLLGLKPCNGYYFTAFSSALVRKGKIKFGFEVVFTLPRTNSWNMFLTDALDLNVSKAERVKSFFCEVTTPPVRNWVDLNKHERKGFFFPSNASFVDRNNPGHAESMVLLMVDLKKARKKVLSAPLILMREISSLILM